MTHNLASVEAAVVAAVAAKIETQVVLERLQSDRSVKLDTLGIDSLDRVEIEIELEDQFNLEMPSDWISESNSIEEIAQKVWSNLPT